MLNDRIRLALEAAGIIKPAAPGAVGKKRGTKTRLKARPTIVNGKWKEA